MRRNPRRNRPASDKVLRGKATAPELPSLFAKAPPRELSAVVRDAAIAQTLSIPANSPEARLVAQAQRSLVAVGLHSPGQYISGDDVAVILDVAGVPSIGNLAQRRRLASAILNGGKQLGLWEPDGVQPSRDARRHHRYITRWKVTGEPAP